MDALEARLRGGLLKPATNPAWIAGHPFVIDR
jgi:hypothetical protein